MASGGKKKKDEDSGFSWGGLFGAAAAAGAAALVAYGAKKLYDHEQEQERQRENEARLRENEATARSKGFGDDYDDYGESSSGYDNDRRSYSSRPRSSGYTNNAASSSDTMGFGRSSSHHSDDYQDNFHSTPKVSTTRSIDLKDMPLKDALDQYYNDYVNIDDRDMAEAKAVLSYIKNHIEDKLAAKPVLNGFTFKELVDTGSAFEGLKVIRPDEFDVMIILEPNDKINWKEDAGRQKIPAFSIIKNVDSSVQSDVIQNGVLVPAKIRSKFQSFIQKAVNDITRYDIHTSTPGPAITLNVHYGNNNEKFMSIDFVPAMVMGLSWLVAKPHPMYKKNPSDSYYSLFWRQSFSREEKCVLTAHKGDSCHLKCLKIIKAIRLNHHSQMGNLSSYVYKTVLMHMLDDGDDWHDEELSERFIEMFEKIHDYLVDGELPHYFVNDKNLLEDFSGDTLKNSGGWIKRFFNKSNFHDMLKTNY